MPDRYRIDLCWAARTESVDGYGKRMHRFVGTLSAMHERLRDWRFTVDDDESRVTSEAECVAGLARTAEVWEVGEAKQTAYQLRFYAGRRSAPDAEMTLTCGIQPLPLEVFAPNRLTMRIRREAPDDLANVNLLHAVLAAGAAAFEADFGHVGSDSVPRPALALYSHGVPPVGWMTFLSKAYPAPPPKLPTPAVTYGAEGGHIVVAFPSPFREHKKKQRVTLDEVTTALRDAGVLLPAHRVSRSVR